MSARSRLGRVKLDLQPRFLGPALIAAPRWRRAARSAAPPREVFAGVSDDEWFWLHTAGRRLIPWLRSLLPAVPPEETQEWYTGSTGDRTLRQAWSFWQLVTEQCETNGIKLEPSSHILDFGCGWGRVIRFFARDTDHQNVLGVDINPAVLDVAERTNRWNRFTPIGIYPPTEERSGSFDLVYAYSVFSHLPEDLAKAWIVEFTRLLRPGGILVVTTRDRDFILSCEALRRELGPDWRDKVTGGRLHAARAFLEPQASLADYDEGRFCFSHRGGTEPPNFGEACISRSYVERSWTEHLRIVDFIDDLSRCGQVVIVAQKPHE